MTTAPRPPVAEAPSLEGLTRTLRHEIGDFLQTVYSTAAILQGRLPESMALERTVVKNLRERAETCRHLLDTLHDLVLPVVLAPAPMHPAELAAKLTNTAAARYPHLTLRAEADGSPEVQADPQRLMHMGMSLLDHACQSAASEVLFRTKSGPAPGDMHWIVSDDGAAVPPELLPHLFDAFSTSRRGTLGLGLGAVHKLATLHGGRVWAENPSRGGLAVHVVLPRHPPSEGEETPAGDGSPL